MNVWQIATGDRGRDYREIFFDHDVMILGPGDGGDARDFKYSGGPNTSDSQVKNFAQGPVSGDRVIMRCGKEVIGVGRVPDDENSQYSHEDAFSCVYGWDLQHTRRVKWGRVSISPQLKSVFDNAKQKPSFTRVHESQIVDLVSEIEDDSFTGQLKEMPSIDSDHYSSEELGTALFQAGISSRNIEAITSALAQASRLCSWYLGEDCGNRPTENEVISHIVLPIFLGLGWSHQQIAVEWNKVDMAFFKKTPTTIDNCVMVLEAKGMGKSLSEVIHQPRRYVEQLGLGNVQKIITTDGANLFVYQVGRDEPIGYLNIRRPQREYLLPRKANFVETLVMLQPSSQ